MKIPSKKQRKKGFNESQRLHPGCGTRSRGGRKKERKKEERKEEEDWQSIQPELKRLAVVVVLVVVVTAVPNRPGGFSCAPGRGGGPREWGELMRTGGGGGGFPKQLAAISTDPIKINEAERGLRVEGASFAPPSAPSPSLASRLDTRLSLFHCGSRQVPSTSRGNSARLVVADAAARREIGGEGGMVEMLGQRRIVLDLVVRVGERGVEGENEFLLSLFLGGERGIFFRISFGS